MRCLFCKADSALSCSTEHILPESIGNTKHVLPPGVVCDKCNNYFSREVEKPFLQSAAMMILRSNQVIPSKRGNIPPVSGVLIPDHPAFLQPLLKGPFKGVITLEPNAIKQIIKSGGGTLILPRDGKMPDDFIISRFLAKAALEAMAERLVEYPDGLAYLVDESQLDLMRDHARRGHNRIWPVHIRRIHDANKKWIDNSGADTQVVHEYDILKTDWEEWFFVVAIFGLELVINIGGPEIDGYERWLREHDNVSPLYWGKNAQNPFYRDFDLIAR